jgi:hypothetical protein
MVVHVAGIGRRVIAGIGLVLLIAIAADTAINKIPKTVSDYRARLEAQSTAPTEPRQLDASSSSGREEQDVD